MAQKILIVEDNPDVSQLLAFCLNDAGYETSRAENLVQGISKALADHPDLIITDLCLPDMSAVDATVILKQDPATSGIPIIVLTAMTVGEWQTKALKAGIAKYLRPRPPSWWKFVSSVSMPEKFLPQLPYNERSQSDQGLGIPLKQPSTASLVLDLSIHRFVAGGSDH